MAKAKTAPVKKSTAVKKPAKTNSADPATLLASGRSTTAEALALFDRLPVVADLDFMFGQWRGSGLHTDHPMDGLLENYDWYGKRFISPDEVHPLLFSDARGGIYSVNPALMPIGMALNYPVLKRSFMKTVFRLGRPVLRTKRTGARLRLTTHRGKTSATMCYDALPIHDVFRKVDANTLLGVMDLKGMEQPFFFILRRDLQA